MIEEKRITHESKKTSQAEIRKYLEPNDDENMTDRNLQETAKAERRGAFITLNASFRKEKRLYLNELRVCLGKGVERQQTCRGPGVSRARGKDGPSEPRVVAVCSGSGLSDG